MDTTTYTLRIHSLHTCIYKLCIGTKNIHCWYVWDTTMNIILWLNCWSHLITIFIVPSDNVFAYAPGLNRVHSKSQNPFWTGNEHYWFSQLHEYALYIMWYTKVIIMKKWMYNENILSTVTVYVTIAYPCYLPLDLQWKARNGIHISDCTKWQALAYLYHFTHNIMMNVCNCVF